MPRSLKKGPTVLRMVDDAEYKRRQYPPGPKITERNFGRDRRVPITSAWREHATVAQPSDAAPPASSSPGDPPPAPPV